MYVAVTADGDNLTIYCHKIKGFTVIKDIQVHKVFYCNAD